MPDQDAARKPARRALSRFWLFGPYVALLIAMIGWSLFWVWARSEVTGRMDAAAERARLAGFTMDWTGRKIGGFPFRIEVTLDGLRLGEPSGWALAAPEVKAETYAYELGHWVAFASHGVVLTRPESGPVAITGPALRASYVWTGQGVPRIAVEGLKLTFAPQGGAKPFLIRTAEHLNFNLRDAGADKAEFLLRIDQATAPPGGVLSLIAQAKPMDIAWQAQASNVTALHGRDWPTAAAAWTQAGGGLDVEHALLTAGPTTLNLRPGRLTIGYDGRLRGTLGLDLRQAPNLIQALAQARTIDPSAADSALTVANARAARPVTQADLTFLAGATAFGPVAIGPSPKVY